MLQLTAGGPLVKSTAGTSLGGHRRPARRFRACAAAPSTEDIRWPHCRRRLAERSRHHQVSSIPALRQRHGARPRPSALSRRHTQATRRHCCRTRKSVAHQYLSLPGGARWQGLLYLSQLAFPSPVSPPPPEPLEFKLNRLAPAGSALGFVVPGPRHPSACYCCCCCCCCCLFAMLLRHLCCPVSLYRPLEFVGKDEETGLGLFGWMAMRRDGPAGGQATKTVAAKDSGVTSPPRPCPTAFPSCGHPRTAKHEPSPRGAKYCPSRTLYLSCTPSSSLLACPSPLLPGGHRATPRPMTVGGKVMLHHIGCLLINSIF